jgi:hypothetical protein
MAGRRTDCRIGRFRSQPVNARRDCSPTAKVLPFLSADGINQNSPLTRVDALAGPAINF